MKLVQNIAVVFIRAKFRILAAVSPEKAAAKAFRLFCTPQSRTLKPLPPVFEAAEQLDFPFRQFTIDGYRWNRGGSKRVLIIHGFESSVINFEHYVQPLIDKGYEVLAFDAPAHGRSSGKEIDLLIYRDFIRYIMMSFGPVQSYMAHSFGSIALCLAIEQVKHDETYKLVLIAPVTETTSTLTQFFQFLKIKNEKVKTIFSKIIVDKGGYELSWFSISRIAPVIKANVLWIHDEDDKITPLSDALQIKEKKYPHIQFVVTKGLGHRNIYRDAQTKSMIVDYL